MLLIPSCLLTMLQYSPLTRTHDTHDSPPTLDSVSIAYSYPTAHSHHTRKRSWFGLSSSHRWKHWSLPRQLLGLVILIGFCGAIWNLWKCQLGDGDHSRQADNSQSSDQEPDPEYTNLQTFSRRLSISNLFSRFIVQPKPNGDESSILDDEPTTDSILSRRPKQKKHPRESTYIQNVLPHISTPGDSKGDLVTIKQFVNDTYADQFNYELCSFTNVCASSDALYLYVQSEEEYNRVNTVIEGCYNGAPRFHVLSGIFGPCHCFYPGFKVKLLPFWEKNRERFGAQNMSTADPSTLPSRQRQTSVDPLTHMNRGHYWGIHQYVRVHHIAHWAQKVMLFQSSMQHAHSFPSPSSPPITYTSYDPRTFEVYESTYTGPVYKPLSGMVLHYTELPLQGHEEAIFNLSIQTVLQHSPHPGLEAYQRGVHLKDRAIYHTNSNMIFATELEATMARVLPFWEQEAKRLQPSSASTTSPDPAPPPLTPEFPQCYERLTWTRAFGMISTTPKDTVNYRANALAKVGLAPILEQRCPPRRIVFLYRQNRHILNWQEVSELVHQMTGKQVERLTIDETTPSDDQIKLFATTGLLLSSHSSQMMNVLFSHPLSTMIEITPEFYNIDFAEYAHGMGVKFEYAIGGEVKDSIPHPGIQECNDVLSHCHGSSQCIINQRYYCRQRHWLNKNNDFSANLTAVRETVQHALDHIQWACGGKW